MIRELRRQHARLSVALAIVPPLLLGAAWIARAPEARTAAVPGATGAAGPRLELAPEFPVEIWATWDASASRLRIVARARPSLVAPDVQLYWTPAGPGPGDALPGRSRFLAAVGSGRAVDASVPAAGFSRGGILLLVTHPDRRIAATTPVLLPFPGER